MERLLRTALDAFGTAGRPDIVHLKSLYLFARDEGYPVKQEWLPSLPAAERAVAAAILSRRLERAGLDGRRCRRDPAQPRGLPRLAHRDHHPVNFDLDRRRAQHERRRPVGLLGRPAGPRRAGPGASGGRSLAPAGTGRSASRRSLEGADAEFEVPVKGEIARKGWLVALAGRIDQVVRSADAAMLREIKTVTRALPAPEAELRADYPGYFVQLAAYAALRGAREPCELVFVEADSGLAQTVALSRVDDRLLDLQLDRVAEFLDLRLRGRERLRQLRFRPAFASPRHGQEGAAAELRLAIRGGRSAVLLEAPTGFGKTGVLLECALGELREGSFERVLYLTGKSTGQLEVVETLQGDDRPGAGPGIGRPGRGLARPQQVRALRQLGLPMRARGLRLPGRRRAALAGERAVEVLPHRGPAAGPRRAAQRRHRRPHLPVRDHKGRPRVQRRLDRRLQLRFLARQPRALLRQAGIRPGAHAPHRRRGAQPRGEGGRRPFPCLLRRPRRAPCARRSGAFGRRAELGRACGIAGPASSSPVPSRARWPTRTATTRASCFRRSRRATLSFPADPLALGPHVSGLIWRLPSAAEQLALGGPPAPLVVPA